jgi:hypothetical protein
LGPGGTVSGPTSIASSAAGNVLFDHDVERGTMIEQIQKDLNK